jgi:uncharacterized protein
MIELGRIQKLKLIRKTPIGAFLNSVDDSDDYDYNYIADDDILLPQSQVPENIEIGDEIEVFVYRDSMDRMISTVRKPKLTIGDIAALNVVEITEIGAFLDWGLEKDLFLPFKEQVGTVEVGRTCLVGLYIDKSDRLCATMNVYDLLSNEAPYKINDRVQGTIYKISNEFGAFVAVDNKYHGLIPNKELYGNYNEGDNLEIRIKNIRPDGKLELSMRKEAYNEIEGDAQNIMEKLKANDGKLPLNDKSSPEIIKFEMNMSKNAFKRAVGRLLKEGAIRITDVGIELIWK